jgi:hypothetical protein
MYYLNDPLYAKNIPNWPAVVVVCIGVVISVVVVEPSSSQRRSPLMQVSQVSSRVGQSLNKMQ